MNQLLIPTSWVSNKPDDSNTCSTFLYSRNVEISLTSTGSQLKFMFIEQKQQLSIFFVAVISRFFWLRLTKGFSAISRPRLWYSSKHPVAIHHVLLGARWREPADAALPIHCPHIDRFDWWKSKGNRNAKPQCQPQTKIGPSDCGAENNHKKKTYYFPTRGSIRGGALRFARSMAYIHISFLTTS